VRNEGLIKSTWFDLQSFYSYDKIMIALLSIRYTLLMSRMQSNNMSVVASYMIATYTQCIGYMETVGHVSGQSSLIR